MFISMPCSSKSLRVTTLLSVHALIAAMFWCSGCLRYNECESATGERIGQAAIDFDIRRSSVRTQETPIGNVVADAIFETATRKCSAGDLPCPDFALQNAGGIRPETSCGLRDEIPSGPVYEQDVKDLLPFENELAVVRFTGADIMLALEHAVSQLGRIGEGAEAGYYLQVSHLKFSVDCSQEAHSLRANSDGISQQGDRIREAFIEKGNDLEPIAPETEYEVALNTYMADGNDGFLAFLLRNGNDLILNDDGNPVSKLNRDQDIVLASDQEPYSDQKALLEYFNEATSNGLALGRPVESRVILFDTCFSGSE
jgi:2',3'-cyclic-nucleotide 2'-phosphodiesterase (5'-nucleotidase family)